MSTFVDIGITYKARQPFLRTTLELNTPSMWICVTGADTSGAWSGISEAEGANYFSVRTSSQRSFHLVGESGIYARPWLEDGFSIVI